MDLFSPQLPISPSFGMPAPRNDRERRGRALADLAARQRGVVSRAQLDALGFDDRTIHDRCCGGQLHRVAPAVFAVGHTGISRRGLGIAGLLQVGAGGALSHDSAARLWGIVSSSSDGPIHISIRSRATLTAPRGVVIHRPRSLAPGDLAVHNGLVVTTPERTVVDQMGALSVLQLTRMLEQMVTVLGRSPDDLHRWAHALPPRAGRPNLWKALDWVAGPAVVRSEFETLFRSVCQSAGLPSPSTNHHIGRWEADAAWLLERVVVELDSWRYHGGRWQFHQDRRKGLALNRAGYEVIRLTWWQLKNEQADVIAAIECALARGRQRMGHR